MRLGAGLLIFAFALTACGPDKPAEPPPAAPKPVEIEIGRPDTPDGTLPPGWSTSMQSSGTVVRAEDGQVYFQFPGDAEAKETNTLSYEIDASIAGQVTFDFFYTVTGSKPQCEVALKQGDKGSVEPASKRHITMTLDKAAGTPATASFSCRATSQVYGFLINPKLILPAK